MASDHQTIQKRHRWVKQTGLSAPREQTVWANNHGPRSGNPALILCQRHQGTRHSLLSQGRGIQELKKCVSKYMLYAWKLLHRTLLFNYTALNIRFLIWSLINSVNTAPVITPPHWREFHLPIIYKQSQLKFSRNKSQTLSITTYTELIHFQFVVRKIRMYEILIKGNNNQTKQKNRKKFF